MHRPADHQSGFTLLELLVSLAILAMTAGIVVAGLGGAHRVWERGDLRQQAGEAVEGAEIVLRQRLENAFPATRYDGSTPYADFTGTSDSIRFLSPSAASYGAGALRRNTLLLAPDGSLTLSSTNDLWRNIPSVIREEILLRGVQSLDVAYFGEAPPDGAPRWRNIWRNRPAPPQLVRIRVRFPPGDSRWWPDMIARPWSSVDTDCVQDPGSGRCRGR